MVRQKPNKKITNLVEGEGKRKSGPIMGIDVHKDVLAYCILTEQKIISEFTAKNNEKGIDSLIALCQNSHVSSVAVESTAQYHFKLVYQLLEVGIPVLIANPQQTKTTQGKKTDKYDARRIAMAHRDGRLKPSVISSHEIMTLRKANRQLFKLINDATKIKQRLNQLFHQKEFSHNHLLKTKSGLQWLDLVSKGMIQDVHSNELAAKYLTPELDGALLALQDRLSEIERISFGNEIMQLRLLQIAMDQQRMAYYALAKQNTPFKAQMKLLLSIPGVGPDTAATILAEIADISYFPTAKQLVKWAGLAPRVYQSGHRKHVTGRIHKGGNKYLRRALVLACQNIHAKGDSKNPLRQFIRSKQKEKDSYWLAVCAGARRLLTIIWYMLKKNFQWGNFKPTPEILAAMTKVVTQKVKLFQSKLKRYTQIREMLSGQSDELFECMPFNHNDPQILLKALLNSV